MTTKYSTWFSPISRFVATVMSIIGLLAVSQGHSSYYAANAATIPRCVDIQLAVSATNAPGGLGHAGMVIDYRNISDTACSLFGYPDVVGLNFATGRSDAASLIRNGYLGGWRGYVNGKAKPLPLVLLRARQGVASSIVQWADCATAQQIGCSVLTQLWVNVPSCDRPFALKGWMLINRYFDATPIVPGNTGSAD